MRVLHVLPLITARAGGPVAFATEAAEALAPLGFGSTLLATDLGHIPSAREWRRVAPEELPPNAAQLDLHLFPVRRPRRWAFSPAMGVRLKQVAGAFDVVHIHSLWLFPQFAGQRAARRAKVPYVVSPHGALDPYLRRHGRVRKATTDFTWQRSMLERAAALHVTTAQEGKLIADIAPSTPRETVPVGVWTARLAVPGSAERFRVRHLGGHAGEVVLFLGRLTYKKGIDVLIRAFGRVARARRDALLVVAGPDDEDLRPRLERIAAAEGLTRRVVFPGPLYRDDRADAFAAASAWALASYTENFGVAVIEALAAGVPTIVSTEVNLADAIRRSEVGVVATPDPDEFGGALLRLLEDRGLQERLAARSPGFAARYDWSTVAPELAAMYRRAASPAPYH